MRTVIIFGALVAGSLGTTAMLLSRRPPEHHPLVEMEVVRAGGMSTARAAHQATPLRSGRVLITGGCTGSCDSSLRSAELFDPASGTFRQAAPMNDERDSHAAAALPDGRVLVVGGWSERRASATAEVWDDAAGSFGRAGVMNVARAAPSVVALADGRVLVTGGQTSEMAPHASAEIYDPATGAFTMTGSMGIGRVGHSATPLPDGRVLVAGGLPVRRGEVLASAELYDPATGTFSPTGDMTVPRHKHAAVVLADGRVMIIGGSDEGPRSGRYRSTEFYDPAVGRFTAGPEMEWRRYKLPGAVALLPSGKVVVGGGAARVELYDGETGRFAATAGSLDGDREFATATLLTDGTVLIVGGYDENIRTSAAAWLVRPVMR